MTDEPPRITGSVSSWIVVAVSQGLGLNLQITCRQSRFPAIALQVAVAEGTFKIFGSTASSGASNRNVPTIPALMRCHRSWVVPTFVAISGMESSVTLTPSNASSTLNGAQIRSADRTIKNLIHSVPGFDDDLRLRTQLYQSFTWRLSSRLGISWGLIDRWFCLRSVTH